MITDFLTYTSDKIRLHYLKNAPKNDDIVNKRLLIDTFDGYDDLIFVRDRTDFIEYYEGFVESCWVALYKKPEYKNLTHKEAVDMLVKDRFSIICKMLDLKIIFYEFKSNILYIKFIRV